jgi:DNA primase
VYRLSIPASQRLLNDHFPSYHNSPHTPLFEKGGT